MHIGADIFVDFRRIHIDLENLGILGKFRCVSRHPVAEAGPCHNQQITF